MSSWIDPATLYFPTRLDKQPFILKGHMGQIGKTLGKKIVVLNFSDSVLAQVDVDFKGNVMASAAQSKFDLTVNVSLFSPRKLLAAMGRALLVSASDIAGH